MSDDDEQQPISDYDFGVYSPHWMLRALLWYVPRTSLYAAVSQAINYMAYNDDPDAGTVMDILAQMAVNGEYIPTEPHNCEEHGEGAHSAMMDPTRMPRVRPVPETQPIALSEEEIQAEVDKFLNELGLNSEESDDD